MGTTAALTATAIAALFALTACGSAAPYAPHTAAARPAAATASATPTPPGPERFIAEVRAAGAGDEDLTSATDQALINIGTDECNIFAAEPAAGTGSAYTVVINTTMEAIHATAHQAAVWAGSAVRNLCPAYTSQLPAGAP